MKINSPGIFALPGAVLAFAVIAALSAPPLAWGQDKNKKDDYSVQVGKHTMQKSQVEKMHPELKKPKVVPSKKGVGDDYPVQIGKHTMAKSKVDKMHPELKKPKASEVKPNTSSDYPVQVGKHTMMKSKVDKMHPELKKNGIKTP